MDIHKLVEQAQALHEKMQRDLDAIEVTGAAGGDMVRITMTGSRAVTAVHLDPEIFKEGDRAMMEDLIRAATNDALRRVDDAMHEKAGSLAPMMVSGLTGGQSPKS